MLRDKGFIKKSTSKEILQTQPLRINFVKPERKTPSQSPTFRGVNRTYKIENKDEKSVLPKKDKSRSKSRS